MIKLRDFSLALGLLAVSALGCGSSPPPAPTNAASATPVDLKNVAPGTEDDLDSDGVRNADDKCPGQKEDGLPPSPKDGCPKA